MNRLLLFIIIMLFAPSFAWSAPVITNSPAIKNGVSTTITGTGFTARSTPPLMFDQFEDGFAAGTNIEAGGVWSRTPANNTKYQSVNQRSANSTRNAAVTFDYNAGLRDWFYKQVFPDTKSKKIVSFWTYMEYPTRVQNAPDDNTQLKYWAFRATNVHGVSPVGYGFLMLQNDNDVPANDQTHRIITPFTGSTVWTKFWRWGTWTRVTLLYDDSDRNVANGYAAMGVKRPGYNYFMEYPNLMTTSTDMPLHLQYLQLGYMVVNANNLIMRTFWDDVYTDNRWDRVEICNANNYDVADKCEIQKITSATSTSVTFTGNPATFPTGSQAFAFYFDNNNVKNSVGYTVDIGAAAPDTTPPVIVSSNPDNGAINIALNSQTTDVFDESLNCSVVNTSSVTSNCGTVTSVGCSGNVVTMNYTGQGNSQSCTRTYSAAVENTTGINLTAPVTRTWTTEAAVEQTCATVDDLCVSETECLTAWPSNYYCPERIPACGPAACDTVTECSAEHLILCTSEPITTAAGLYWDTRDGGFARTTPVPTDEIGSNLATNSDVALWDTRAASGGYDGGYIPTGFLTYDADKIFQDPQGVRFIDGGHIIPAYRLIAGKRYRWTQNVYSVAQASKFWWFGVDDFLNYTVGTHSVTFTVPAEPISDHGFYTGTITGGVVIANHFQLYEVLPEANQIYKIKIGGSRIKTVSATP